MDKILFVDLSQYQKNDNKNSEGYAFSELYEFNASLGGWLLSYGTSADFDYCNKCGGWHKAEDCPHKFTVLSNKAFLRRLKVLQTLCEAEPAKFKLI